MPAIKTDPEQDLRNKAVLIEEMERQFSPSGLRQRRFRRSQSLFWLAWVNILNGGKRSFDFAISSMLLLACSPLFVSLYCFNLLRRGGVVRSPRLGRWGAVFQEYSFSVGVLRQLPTLVNVWKGDMSLVGPRPVAPTDVSSAERLAWKRLNTRPGFLCLWWIRSRANIAYGSEVDADAEYVDSQSFLGDLGIALRAIPAALYGQGVTLAPDRVDLLGITIHNVTMDEAIEEIVIRARGSVCSQVCFVNADCANIAWDDAEYGAVLKKSDLVLADGIGMKLAGKLLNRNIRQNVNGTDLLPRLCEVLRAEQLGVYLLGGRPGIAADVAQWMATNYPGLSVSGHHHGYFLAQEMPEILAEVRRSGAKILLVAFGVPRQELWISRHLEETGAVVSMGVGGLFDFYSGRVPRAAAWIREIGMEWCYRFVQEPRRMWRRYFVGNVVFLARVVRERCETGNLP
ncbi:N-acetylmannosaminyltransferase [Acidisarcina polymorpha]|uniref:N-acetylmannosaminyltransferase n=1 Tax=Acidisarcina polymorpha TaxID=2211140 RepID=A0A2Z5FTI1_9BACT|nr:WecB/TagA/CpsF family glycosyltransferase [Acidisarcina polymorpha]AXC10133.1 N-acetylmannosaminyltransferase [Acidisarcina polymorpha]